MIPPSSQKPHGVLKTVLKTVQDELKKQVGYKVRMSLSRTQGGSWHCKGVKPCVVYAETLARHKILWKDKSWYRQLIFLEYNISNIFHSMFHVQICPSQEASLPKKHIVWQMMVSVSDGSTCSVISLLVSGVSSINGIIPVEFSMEPEKITRKGDAFWKPSLTGSMLSFGGVHLPFFRLQIFPHPMTFRFGVTYCATFPLIH